MRRFNRTIYWQTGVRSRGLMFGPLYVYYQRKPGVGRWLAISLFERRWDHHWS